MALVVEDLGLATVLGSFFAPTPAPTLPVVVVLFTACLPLLTVLTFAEALANPLGNGALDLA